MGSSLVPIMLIVVLLVALVIFLVLNNRPARPQSQPPRRGLNPQRHQSGTVPVREDPAPPVADDPPDLTDPAPPPTVAVPAASARAGADIRLATVHPISERTGEVHLGGEHGGTTRVSDTRTHRAGPGGNGAAGDTEKYELRSPPSAGETGVHRPNSAGRSASRAPASRAPGGTASGGRTSGGESVMATVPADDVDNDPDETGWTPPPDTAPHPAPVAGRGPIPGYGPASLNDEVAETTRYYDPKTGDFPIAPPTTNYVPRPAEPDPGAVAAAAATEPYGDATTTALPGSARPARPARPATHPEHVADLVADEPEQPTAAPLRLAAAGRTRRGKRGGPNEDAFVVVDGLLAVSDGVGGEAAGQIASTLTVTTVAGFRPQYSEDPLDGLRKAVERANWVVRTRAREEPTWLGMACTLDVVVLGRQRSTGEFLTVAHVGDSSVWLQPGRGRPRALTTPHAIRNGPLLNAVGLADEIEADIFSEPVRAGDRVVLASDGITKVMTPEQLDGLLSELGSSPPERAADALVEAALLAGARDDTTIVVADLVSEPSGR